MRLPRTCAPTPDAAHFRPVLPRAGVLRGALLTQRTRPKTLRQWLTSVLATALATALALSALVGPSKLRSPMLATARASFPAQDAEPADDGSAQERGAQLEPDERAARLLAELESDDLGAGERSGLANLSPRELEQELDRLEQGFDALERARPAHERAQPPLTGASTPVWAGTGGAEARARAPSDDEGGQPHPQKR